MGPIAIVFLMVMIQGSDPPRQLKDAISGCHVEAAEEAIAKLAERNSGSPSWPCWPPT